VIFLNKQETGVISVIFFELQLQNSFYWKRMWLLFLMDIVLYSTLHNTAPSTCQTTLCVTGKSYAVYKSFSFFLTFTPLSLKTICTQLLNLGFYSAPSNFNHVKAYCFMVIHALIRTWICNSQITSQMPWPIGYCNQSQLKMALWVFTNEDFPKMNVQNVFLEKKDKKLFLLKLLSNICSMFSIYNISL